MLALNSLHIRDFGRGNSEVETDSVHDTFVKIIANIQRFDAEVRAEHGYGKSTPIL